MLLADIELDEGDTASAAADWSQARDVYGDDVIARRRYAVFLLRSGRAAEAERELRAVLVAEPDWVDAHRDLARAVDAQREARRADAVAAYEEFLRRAPDDPAEPRRDATERLAALRAR
jgi:predicted Zn-dependent protease